MERRKFIFTGVSIVITLSGCTNINNNIKTDSSNIGNNRTDHDSEEIPLRIYQQLTESTEVEIEVNGNEILLKEIPPEKSITVDTGISQPGNYNFRIYIDGEQQVDSDFDVGDYMFKNDLRIILTIKSDGAELKREG